jgi:cytoskeletal protein CcmA (bactofilin family)
MESKAEIGSSIVIKGDVTAHEDIVVSGRVEGSITVVGHAVTVKAGAELVADIRARAIDVSGQVVGTLCADERIELRETADVEGELNAPALRLEYGAEFQGKAETTKAAAKAGLQLAS